MSPIGFIFVYLFLLGVVYITGCACDGKCGLFYSERIIKTPYNSYMVLVKIISKCVSSLCTYVY